MDQRQNNNELARAVWPALWAGMRGRCPNCHEGKIFKSFLKVAHSCDVCGEELHHHRADDAPPYLTIFVVGHIVVPLMLIVEQTYAPAMWVHWLTWPLLALTLALSLLPAIKGGFVNLQWAMRMHGFEQSDSDEPAPIPAEVPAE